MYLAEISSANIRGSLVALQQLSITLGVCLSLDLLQLNTADKMPRYHLVVRLTQDLATSVLIIDYRWIDWIAYGTSHIGGTRCAPDVPYTGRLLNGKPTFDAFNDVPPGGCTGQTNASWSALEFTPPMFDRLI
jgi:hypothetical protein